MTHPRTDQADRFTPPNRSVAPRRLLWPGAFAVSLLVTWLIYYPALQGVFTLDDANAIKKNPTILELHRLDRVLFYESEGGRTIDGRPVLNLSLALDFARGERDPAAYRTTNYAIHALNGVLFAALLVQLLRVSRLPRELRRGTGPVAVAGAAALLWLVHPLNSGAVAYIVQRAESLAACMILLSLNLFVAGMWRRSWPWLLAAGLAGVLGTLTKETAATIPLVAMVLDYAFLRRRGLGRLRWVAYPSLLLSWVAVVAVTVATGGRGGSAGRMDPATVWAYLLDQGLNVPWYLRLMVWPDPLVFDYGPQLRETTPMAMLAFGLVTAGFLAVVVGFARRPRPFAAPLIGALLLAPSSSVIPVLTQSAAEHRMYLTSAALIAWVVIAAAWAISRAPAGRRSPIVATGAAVGLLVAVALGVRTWDRSHDYQSLATLWASVIRHVPENPRGWRVMGSESWEAGRRSEAIEMYRRAVDLEPDNADHWSQLAAAWLARPAPRRALAIVDEAMQRTDPAAVPLLRVRARALAALNRFPEAADTFQLYLLEDLAMASDWLDFATVLRRMERWNAMEWALSRIETFAPGHPGLLVERAAAARMRGDLAEATGLLRPVLGATPAWGPALRERGAIRAARGELERAEADLTRALDANRNDQEAWLLRAGVRLRDRRPAAAADDLREAARRGAQLPAPMQQLLIAFEAPAEASGPAPPGSVEGPGRPREP